MLLTYEKKKQKGKDKKINLSEFKEFYNIISCTIEDDAAFENQVLSTWKMSA